MTQTSTKTLAQYTWTDFLELKENRPVLKQFALYFVAMIVIPIGLYFTTNDVLRHFNLQLQTRNVISAVVALASCQALMGYFAYTAYTEEADTYAKTKETEQAETRLDSADVKAGNKKTD
ncbi:MAG: uncharacterized protein KVP18_000020 [Porospora cf. gigantea A]|uniref:uncharacterized protein n=1 Tax=Porospora cf. gigantea A TaxID=2853593 RepID=UPI00355951AF|nr:MAG: hypothetical protein KVP18_000020 [Porospora cf. gigantea A]